MSDTVQIKTDTVKLTIDGREVEVPKGTLVIEAARKLGVEVPFFCYHPKLKPDGNCRMCLVSIEKMPKLQVSCSLPVSEGMVVHTNTAVVTDARKGVLDFLLANHPLDCPICDEGGRCPLQNYSQKYTGYGQFKEEKRIYEKDYFSPLIEKEMNRCVQCMRCVRYCDEMVDSKALAPVHRGYQTEIGHYGDKQLDCEFCGGCVQICPVGALLNRLPLYEYRPWMLTHTETTCAYCADGCSLRLESRPQTREVIEVTSFWGNEPKSVWEKGRNEGDLCAKGYYGYPFVNSPNRLTKPLIRKDGRRDGPLVEASWEEAIERVAEGFGRIKTQHGGSAFGAVIAPPLTALVAGRWGWRGAFLFTGLLGLLWLPAWLAACRGSSSHLPVQAPQEGSMVPLGQLLRDGRVQRILAARFLFDPVFYFYMFWIPQYLARERHFSLEQIGSYYWIPFLALGFSNILSGRLSDGLVRSGWTPRRARAFLLTLAALITPVSWLASLAPNPGWAIALMTALMAAHGLWISNFLGLLGDLFPSRAIATITGLTGTAGGVGGMLSNLIVGPVVDRFSFAPAFAVSGVLYPAALLILLWAIRTKPAAGS